MSEDASAVAPTTATLEYWGRLDYAPAYDRQRELHAQVEAGARPDTLVLVVHPPVLTLGANFHPENLLHPQEFYRAQGIDVTATDRGGDVTYHGDGQWVIYPIFDLRRHGKDLHRWLRDLEETMLLTLSRLGLQGRRFPPHTGAWINDRKVASIGVKVRRWVSFHGIALNVSPNLDHFNLIVPCGIADYPMTSIEREVGRPVTMREVQPHILRSFEEVFHLRWDPPVNPLPSAPELGTINE